MCRSDTASKARVLRALQLLFLLLPIDNRKVLKRILELLNLTASHVSTNRMSSQNLATLFTPHLLCPRKVRMHILIWCLLSGTIELVKGYILLVVIFDHES